MTRRDCLSLFPSLLLAANPSQSAATRKAMEEVMGPLPPLPRTPPTLRVLEETPTGSYLRRRIAYTPEPGDEVPAWLLLPNNPKGKAPAILCLHQTTRIGKDEPAGLGGKPNLHYAHELAQRGYIALAPDYPNFGDYRFDPYQHGYQSATMKGIVNHRRAVDLLRTLPEVDTRHLGVIGHSLGGHNALFLAAFDTRLSAVITSCGFTSFHRYYNGDLTGWSHKGYMPRIASAYGKSPDRMPFDFPDVLAAIAPRWLFINAPTHDDNFDVTGVRECVGKAKPAWGTHESRIQTLHPEAGHDFPPGIREQAYAFLRRWRRL